MNKKVILKLDGMLEHGCRVVLEIWSARGTQGESSRDRHLEAIGYLPPNPQLAELAIAHWQKYRALGDPARSLQTRLNPESITYNGSFNRTRECRESARDLKAELQAWLDSTEFRPIERFLRDELHRRDRIRLQIRAEDPQLQKLPWHLWDWIESRSVEVEFYFLPSNRSLPLLPPAEDGDRVRILAILGHSNGIDVEADRQVLESLPDADVRFLVEPKRQDLCDRFWEQPWDILFFAGHSETEGERGRIYLNPTDSLTLDELWFGLSQAVKRGLQLAIFNSCDGLGLAQQLGDLQLPQMVVMRELVADRVAQAFLKYFLKAFSQGKPFELAVRQGREQLEGLEDEYPCASWLPAIVAHPQAPSLLWVPGLRPPEHAPPPPPNPTPPTPPLPRREGWKTVLAASLAMAGVTMGVRSLGWLQTWELQTFDRLLQLQPDEPPDPRIATVTITEADIQAQNPEARQGSLSNETLDRLLQKLNTHKARVIGLDIYRPFALDAQHQRLADEFKNNNKFIVICNVGGGSDNPPIPPPSDVPLTQIGFSDIPIDPDGIVRRQLFGMSPGKECETEVSLSFAIAQRYLEAEGIEFKFASPNSYQIGTVRFPRVQPNTGGYHQVDNGGYQVMLN
ncbi:MAG: CHASE2 domain-containing protein [Cyanobacteria bacterium J055]|nr:MAG: CHASE2 domain-containing protein [Cyanobacteria bacterium J055]